MNRITSVYTLTVEDAPGLLDHMIQQCPALVSEGLTSEGLAKLRFRTAGGDERARQVAAETTDKPHHLSTGVGVHFRKIY